MKQLSFSETRQNFEPILGFRPHIRYKGVWDMQDLYEFMINFFRERKYIFHEKVYKHKHPSPFGAERQYVWLATRDIDDIYRYNIHVYIHTYDAQDVPVKLKDGTVKTYAKGRIWIDFIASMQLYYDERWNERRFWSYIRMFLNNYLMRKSHGWREWDILVYRELQKLVWLTRRRLKMEYDDYEQKYWTGVHA